jgi:hypothetical protein
MTIRNHTLGFPRVGLRRELKKAQESYWAGNATREELLTVGASCAPVTGISKSRRALTCCRWAISPGTTMF